MIQFSFKNFLLFSILIILINPTLSNAQKKNTKESAVLPWEVDTLIKPIPLNRQLYSDRIDAEIKKIDLRDGELDNALSLDDTLISKVLTQSLLKEIPLIKIHIENLEVGHQEKIKYHKELLNLTRRLSNMSFNLENLSYIKNSVQNFGEILIALQTNDVQNFIKKNKNIYTLDNINLLSDFPKEKAAVFETVGNQYPEMMIKRLPDFAKEAYADPIVAAAAKILPGTILNYATSTSYLSDVVRRNKDPLVQTIVQIATFSKNPLKALPFLDFIHNKTKTIAEIDELSKSEKEYYKALVAAKIANPKYGIQVLNDELNYRGLLLVRVVNELHDSPAPVRFKSIMDYNAAEIYFMIIASQDEIYTSSFTWMFDRMKEIMAPEKGNDFLNRLNKSNFRTFIRMCAGYNKLAPFLQTMDEKDKVLLMKEFVANLEKGNDDELEDAVDVADAFGSITDTSLVNFLKAEVKTNYEKVYKANNKESTKGLIIYGLLSTIFNSAENSDQLTNNLSIIPPITFVPNTSLKNENGEIIVQAFFYGDADGKMSYNSFRNNFNNSNWKSSTNAHWVTYTSTGSQKIIVYANLPHNEPEDETAQKELAKYFSQNNIQPSMVIHRGHSYHLDGSLNSLTPNVKVVMLGSCGGYHNLAKVLDRSPDANIISSKQVGAASINDPIIAEMLKQLLNGNDLNWLNAWSDLSSYFSKRGAMERDLFSDYIPPNKNLGAIFIKAYRKLSLQAEF